MDDFENNLILNRIGTIKHFFGYVDDCLLLIERDRNEAHKILDIINNINNNIKVSLELEKDNKLNNLYLVIKRTNHFTLIISWYISFQYFTVHRAQLY